MRAETEKDDKTRLLETARSLIAQGHAKFSIAALCEEAGVDRDVFRTHFSGRAELMTLLEEASASEPAPAPQARPPAGPEAEPVPVQTAAAMTDAWLERRLRVFERALAALEARAEAAAREHATAIARLEENVRVLTGAEAMPEVMAGEARPLLVANGGGAVAQTGIAMPDLEMAISTAPAAAPEISSPSSTEASGDSDATQMAQAHERQAALLLPLETPSLENPVPRAEMAELLARARSAVRAVVEQQTPEKPRPRLGMRLRWLVLGCLSLVVLFIGIGLTLGDPAGAMQIPPGDGVSYRHVSKDAFARMVARADNGDARAQAGLALAYLRGGKVGANPRAAMHWAGQAARAGDPLGQYLMGTFYHQGEVVPADPRRAFRWFAAAAARGNIRAMHNLAIAYAEGLGTAKDVAKAAGWFARAAERGYVDSAFDLAVLFERGDGVPQDPVQALKWYQVAALLGDRPSQERADMLRHQMNHRDVMLADGQAREFERLTPLASANALPAF
jgi:TPR repeat protein